MTEVVDAKPSWIPADGRVSTGVAPGGEIIERLGAAEQISDRKLEMLFLRAQGFSNPDIAEELNLSEQTVKNHLQETSRRFGVNNTAKAIIKAADMGLLDLSVAVLEDFNPDVLKGLSPREVEIFMLIATQGLTSDEVATTLGISHSTVDHRVVSTMEIIQADSREQFIAIFHTAREMARQEASSKGEDPDSINLFGNEEMVDGKKITQRELQALFLSAYGLDSEEAGKMMDVSAQEVKNLKSDVLRKYGSRSITAAVVRAVELGHLHLDELVPEDFNEGILTRLTPSDLKVLWGVLEGYTNKDLALKNDVTEPAIHDQIGKILKKIGARNRTQAVVYLMEAEIRNKLSES